MEPIALQAFQQQRQKQDTRNLVTGRGTKAALAGEEESLKTGPTTVQECAGSKGKGGNGWRVKSWESHGVNMLLCYLRTTTVDHDKVLMVN